MKNAEKIIADLTKAIAEISLRNDANSASCFAIYQPKAPAALSRFKKQGK